jgi:hypothetical protein
MTRLMFDSISPSGIPASAVMVAGYLDGVYANIPEMRARFPHATVVPVAVSASYPAARGVVLDVETGDATPAQAVAWCRAYAGSNSDLTVYCDSSTWPQVRAAFQSAGVSEPQYWIAAYDGDPSIPAGAVAKQYANNDSYDTSSVVAYWPGVDPIPEADMPLNAADEAAIKTIVTDAIQENRGVAVADLLYWLAAGVTGVPPQGAPPVDVASIKTLHGVVAQLGGLSASLAALAKEGGLTAEQVTAAAEAGATAALAKLGQALDPPAAA